MSITEVCYNSKDNVRYPCREHWWCVVLDGEGSRDRLQHNIAEAQCETYT